MVDELRILELLFADTYLYERSYEGWSDDELIYMFTNQDISEKLEKEFDKIRSVYLDLASSREPIDILKHMFTFRYNRLLKFKKKFEQLLKSNLDNLIILGKHHYDTTAYNIHFTSYKGVISLLDFIVNDSCVSLNTDIDSKFLESKYEKLKFKQIQKWHAELIENYSSDQDSVIVDGMTIDLTHAKGDIPDIDFIPDVDREMKMASEYNDQQNKPRTFEDFISGVLRILRTYSKNSLEENSLYEGIEAKLLGLLKSEKPNREDGVLNFLMEVNVAEQETYEFVIQEIKQDLFEKNDSTKFKILTDYLSRLNKLNDNSEYENLNRLRFVSLVHVTLPRLIEFVKNELSKYDGLIFENKTPLIDFDKIKTNLTVPQISMLFRLLKDDEIIECKGVSQLARQIASSFSSAGKDDFKDGKIRNTYYSLDPNEIAFWDIRLSNLKQLLQKYSKK